MGSSIRFSIVIPTFNRPGYAFKAVTSLLRQRIGKAYQCEILVINDGSTVSYEEFFRSHQNNIVYLEGKENRGVSAARNLAAQQSMGDWLVFLDDDDELKDGYLSMLSQAIIENPSIDIFWGGVAVSKPSGMEVIRYSCHSHHQEDLYKDFLSIGTGFGVAIKKSKFFDVGMFDVTYRVAEDTEFFLRALCCELKVMPIETIAAIKNENHNERLSYGYKAYSSAHIYERIFRQYEDFFKRYPYIYAAMLFWAYRVHNANHNTEGVSAVLADLFFLGYPLTHIKLCEKNKIDLSPEYLQTIEKPMKSCFVL